MFNKPSWNNRRGGYLKPIDKEQADKKRNLLEQMKVTLEKNQKAPPSEPVKKTSLMELAKQEHYNLDASIAEEVQKQVIITTPKLKGKMNPIIIPLPQEQVEEVAVEIEEATEDVPLAKEKTFLPPDSVDTDINDLLNALKTLETYFQSAKRETIFLGDRIHNADYETSDFLHSIELSAFSPEEKIELIDKITELRQRRRTYKIRQEFFKEIEQFVDNNYNIANKLGALRAQLTQIQDKHNTAQYFTRIRTDIKQDDRVHIGFRAGTQK